MFFVCDTFFLSFSMVVSFLFGSRYYLSNHRSSFSFSLTVETTYSSDYFDSLYNLGEKMVEVRFVRFLLESRVGRKKERMIKRGRQKFSLPLLFTSFSDFFFVMYITLVFFYILNSFSRFSIFFFLNAFFFCCLHNCASYE